MVLYFGCASSRAAAALAPSIGQAAAVERMAGQIKRSARRSALSCRPVLKSTVLLSTRAIWAAAVAAPIFSTRMWILPESATVEAKTWSPTPFSAGTASPVRMC